MGLKCVEQLLRENQASNLRERRRDGRKPFARPVQIVTGQSEPHEAFSRDISAQGIGVISRTEWSQSTVATMTIHSVKGTGIRVRAEARWSSPYGDGWYLSGWSFLC